MPSVVKVDGLNDTLKSLRQMGDKDTQKAIKQANIEAAEEVVPVAKQQAPKRSGKLVRSITKRASQKSASVKAGSPTRVPYAGIIHFGGRTSGKFRGYIRPNPFLYEAVDKRIKEVRDKYEKQMQKVIDKFNA